MNEHDGLEPTVAMPRVEAVPAAQAYYPPPQPVAAQPLPPQPIPPQPIPAQVFGQPGLSSRPAVPGTRSSYAFGNPLAYALRRFLAFAVDFVVVTGVVTMLLYGLIAINPFTGLPNNSEGGFDATVGMGIASALIYVWLFEAILGTTLGKLAFSLHVYAPKGGRFVGFARAFVRNLLRPIDLLVVGPILAMAPGHRRLGDLFGGTLVAQSPLRAFSPLVGWLLIAGLVALPFFVAGGTVTVLAVATAFVEFIPPLIARGVHTVLLLFGAPGVHLPTTTG